MNIASWVTSCHQEKEDTAQRYRYKPTTPDVRYCTFSPGKRSAMSLVFSTPFHVQHAAVCTRRRNFNCSGTCSRVGEGSLRLVDIAERGPSLVSPQV